MIITATATTNEQSSGVLTFDITDPSGTLVDPPLVYRVDDYDTKESIRAETSITSVSGVLSIPYTPDDTVILDENNRVEHRIFTIIANQGQDNQYVEEFVLHIRNLEFI